MALTSSKLPGLKPKLGKNGLPVPRTKIKDLNNLYLNIFSNKSGYSKRWVFRKLIDGKDKVLFIGDYPSISLDDARAKAIELNREISNGGDPFANIKTERFVEKYGQSPESFEIIARNWFTTKKCNLSLDHQKKIIRSLERDVFPYIGNKGISNISSIEILSIVQRIENRGSEETAHRVSNRITDIFNYAMALGLIDNNPAISVNKLLKPVQSTNYAATVEPDKFRFILRKIYAYTGRNPATAVLLKLSTMLPSRPGELRTMRWSDLDFQRSEWRYFVTKTKKDHIVSLPKQAVALLLELKKITGTSEYVFPSSRDFSRPMSDGTLKAAFVAMDIDTQNEQTPHGFRACFRTMADEVLGAEFSYIDTQLAHRVPDANGRAYNRTRYLPQRKVLMQTWADYLDDLRESDDDVNQIALRHMRHS